MTSDEPAEEDEEENEDEAEAEAGEEDDDVIDGNSVEMCPMTGGDEAVMADGVRPNTGVADTPTMFMSSSAAFADCAR